MKLLITIVQDQDAPELLESLVEQGFGATKLASTGGFLRTGNTTVLIGVAQEQVGKVLNLIEKNCKKREQFESVSLAPFTKEIVGPRLEKIVVGGAIIFMVDVERFERI